MWLLVLLALLASADDSESADDSADAHESARGAFNYLRCAVPAPRVKGV